MKRKKVWIVLVIYLFNINIFSETLVSKRSTNTFFEFNRLKSVLIDEYEDILSIQNIKYKIFK